MEFHFSCHRCLIPRVHRLVGGRYRDIGGDGGEESGWVEVCDAGWISGNDAIGPHHRSEDGRHLGEVDAVLGTDLDGGDECLQFRRQQRRTGAVGNVLERGDDCGNGLEECCPTVLIWREERRIGVLGLGHDPDVTVATARWSRPSPSWRSSRSITMGASTLIVAPPAPQVSTMS